MSKKKEKPVQFILPFAGGPVNQCYFVSEDELEERSPAEKIPDLLEKAVEGSLSPTALSRFRQDLLRQALNTDRAEALPRLMPKRRMELAEFLALFSMAEEAHSPDAMAWLLAYRKEHYSPKAIADFEQRRLDLELGLADPTDADLRRLFRLRYVKGGVCVCGLKTAQRSVEIPAAIGGKPVLGVDAAAFYGLDPMPSVRREFAEKRDRTLPVHLQSGDSVPLGRFAAKKGTAELPLSWRVLRREQGRALVLCERPVAVLPYHRQMQETSWAACDLRCWLNTVFLPLCFAEEERRRILRSTIETPDNPNYGTPGGAAAEDRLFLLSAEEAAAEFPEDSDRALGCWWWLRTPGFDNSFAAAVTPDGAIMRIGSFVDTEDYAVRPAMWIEI